MARFRKRPVVVEAVRWEGNNISEVLDFRNTGPEPLWGDDFKINQIDAQVLIVTLEGVMAADRGDWIIRGIKGEFYPCKPDIFEATYEPE